jgi:antitoxin VapB
VKTTKTFKSGNSVAVRLPRSLGVDAGVEMIVREERGRYIVEPVAKPQQRIDLTGIFGSIPGLERQPFEEKERSWDPDGR